jgi:hypothetical protein
MTDYLWTDKYRKIRGFIQDASCICREGMVVSFYISGLIPLGLREMSVPVRAFDSPACTWVVH